MAGVPVRLAMYFAIAFSPVALWLVFSYVYYGFRFPILLRQGRDGIPAKSAAAPRASRTLRTA